MLPGMERPPEPEQIRHAGEAVSCIRARVVAEVRLLHALLGSWEAGKFCKGAPKHKPLCVQGRHYG